MFFNWTAGPFQLCPHTVRSALSFTPLSRVPPFGSIAVGNPLRGPLQSGVGLKSRPPLRERLERVLFPISAHPVSLSNRPITNNCPLRLAQETDLYSTHRPLGEPVEPTINQQMFPSTSSGNEAIPHRSVSLSNRPLQTPLTCQSSQQLKLLFSSLSTPVSVFHGKKHLLF